MSQYRDYSAPTVGQSRCSYSSLANVYSGRSAGNETMNMANYVVPKLCANGSQFGLPSYPPPYDTLSHGQQYACGGYFGFAGAYPFANCTSCKADYIQRPCKGDIFNQCGAPAQMRR